MSKKHKKPHVEKAWAVKFLDGKPPAFYHAFFEGRTGAREFQQRHFSVSGRVVRVEIKEIGRG